MYRVTSNEGVLQPYPMAPHTIIFMAWGTCLSISSCGPCLLPPRLLILSGPSNIPNNSEIHHLIPFLIPQWALLQSTVSIFSGQWRRKEKKPQNSYSAIPCLHHRVELKLLLEAKSLSSVVPLERPVLLTPYHQPSYVHTWSASSSCNFSEKSAWGKHTIHLSFKPLRWRK